MNPRGRPDKEDYFALGAIITFVTLVWCAYTYQTCGAVFDRCAFDPIKEWQTLLSATFAISIGGISLWQVQSHRTKSRLRRASAYKANLPLIISQMSTYLKLDCKKLYDCLNPTSEEEGYSMPELQWVKNENLSIEIIRGLIEFGEDDEEQNKRLILFLARLQIYKSRRQSNESGRLISKHNLVTSITDCIDLYALAMSLLISARPEDLDGPSVSFEEANSAMNSLTSFRHDNDVWEELKHIHGQNRT